MNPQNQNQPPAEQKQPGGQTPPEPSALAAFLEKHKNYLTPLNMALAAVLIIVIFIGMIMAAFSGPRNKSPQAMVPPTLTPKPIEPAKWQTFTTLEGMTFKYPDSGWSISEDKLQQLSVSNLTLTYDDYADPRCRARCPSFTITIEAKPNPDNFPMRFFIKKEYGDAQFTNLKLTDFDAGTDIAYKKLEGKALVQSYFSLYTENDSRIFSLTPGGKPNTKNPADDHKYVEGMKVFDYIVKSVKFIKTPLKPTIPPTPIVEDENQTMCTMEVKQCSNGDYVGRTGPNCEFKCTDGSTPK